MEAGDIPVLTRFSDSGQAIPSADEDIRGRKVTERSGNELGKVGDLIIDEEEHKIRFLLLEHGGFLGVGKEKSYLPVDAVAEVSEDQIRIDRTRDQVVDAPEYDPELVQQDEYYDRLYAHYDYPPFWMPGYVYPRWPYLR
ncbi:PRC-barrel domain-containing protein [Streptomyces sp. AS58]|uniref:PRC-barrel domain-containing protein n=1 Tax=Streptomyces sp. AS58 TaxID=1519489 RepID=UPI0006B003FA|nr:PRC-barrel domain-containing protein [Streptomyces sp. AS58]KOV52038.1 PRC-barrel domain-containing protein [Streptomyces sp. AS58]